MSTPLFVYGTLRAGECNAGQLDRIPGGSRRPGRVRGIVVILGQGGPYTYPGLTLTSAGPVVPGEVFETPELDAHWERLDAFEGGEYRRVRTRVETDAGPVEAWVYEHQT